MVVFLKLKLWLKSVSMKFLGTENLWTEGTQRALANGHGGRGVVVMPVVSLCATPKGSAMRSRIQNVNTRHAVDYNLENA